MFESHVVVWMMICIFHVLSGKLERKMTKDRKGSFYQHLPDGVNKLLLRLTVLAQRVPKSL